ncbi:MAG: C4-dicarboxylate ABC transporter permease [Deltaproteobacteria bacterium]|nr:MAG: C4-dicarboxylate ABC transporter permease [Deltaproteobacteria bacterium]
MIRRLLDNLYRLSGLLAAVFLLLICLLVICQVGCNLIDRVSALVTGTAVGLTIPSYADFTGFLLAASSFLALAYTMRSGGHIRVTLFFSRLGGRMRRIFEGWCLLVAAAITVYFAWYTGNLLYESFVYNDLSPGMVAVPLWIPQSAMLLGLVILAVSLLDDLVCLLRTGSPSYRTEEKK